jgi:hypothetical protein
VPFGLFPSSGAQVERKKASETCLIAAIASGDAVSDTAVQRKLLKLELLHE